MTNSLLVGIGFGLVSSFPPLIAGALFMLTPVYFLASIWSSAQQAVVRIAFVIGVVMGPVMAHLAPGFDLLYAGIGGGTIAYLIDRRRRKNAQQSGGGAA